MAYRDELNKFGIVADQADKYVLQYDGLAMFKQAEVYSNVVKFTKKDEVLDYLDKLGTAEEGVPKTGKTEEGSDKGGSTENDETAGNTGNSDGTNNNSDSNERPKEGPSSETDTNEDSKKNDLDLSDVQFGGLSNITPIQNDNFHSRLGRYIQINKISISKNKFRAIILAFGAQGNDSLKASDNNLVEFKDALGTTYKISLGTIRKELLVDISYRGVIRFNCDFVKEILKFNGIRTSLGRFMGLNDDNFYYGFVGSEYCRDLPSNVRELIQKHLDLLDKKSGSRN